MKKQPFHSFLVGSLLVTGPAVLLTSALLLCMQALMPLSSAAADDRLSVIEPAGVETTGEDVMVETTGTGSGGSTGDAAVMTESQAIEQALQQSRNLMFLETDVEIAEYRRDSAGSLDNPELRLEDSMDRSGKNQDDEYRFGFRWRPPGYGERSEDRLAASVESSRKRIEALRYRHRLISRVRKEYAEALMKDDLAELAWQWLDLETRRLGIVEQMVELGRRSIVYMTKARMWLAETRHEYAQSLKRQKSARRNLSQLTGEPEDIALVHADILVITQDVDVLTSIAMERRPETELSSLQTELAIQRSRVEKYKLVPRMTFVDMSYAFENNRDDRMEVRMGIELPLFRWNTDYIEAKELAVRRKEIESSAIREQIKDEINEAYEVYLDCLSDWQNFNDDITGMIAETEQVISQAGENQVLDPDEVLELDLVLVKTRQILVEKRCRLAEALADLYFAMGVDGDGTPQLLEEVIGTLAGN